MKLPGQIIGEGMLAKAIKLRLFRISVVIVAFFATTSAVTFAAEDMGSLVAQADKALALGDYEQALELGKRIVDADPRNLRGYALVLIYCAQTGRELGFNSVIEAAVKNGIPQLEMDHLAAVVLLMVDRRGSAYDKLYAYEMKWRKAYDKPR